MQTALRLTTWVRAGGKVEFTDAQLPTGKSVDVIVLLPPMTDTSRRSVVDILAEAPGHLAFQNVEEVDAYLREEREAWER